MRGYSFFLLALVGSALWLAGCDESAPTVDDGQALGGAPAMMSGEIEPMNRGVLTGTVLLDALTRFDGVFIEAVDRGVTATTAVDGSFRLTVPLPAAVDGEGEKVTLRISKSGFVVAEPEVRMKVGETTQLDELTLRALPGSVSGRVVFPTGFSAEDHLQSVVLSLQADGGEAQTGTFDESGGFTFADLRPGDYRFAIRGGPFREAGTGVYIGPGETVLLPDVILQIEESMRRQYETAVEGVARLQGVTNEGGHGDIFVEVVDGVGTATTRGDGFFRIVVDAGAPTLRLSKVGYGAQDVSVGEVVARQTKVLPEAVLLTAQPGTIAGRVTLAHYETADRLQAVDVSLYGEGDAPVAVTRPDSRGRFVFDAVRAGQWRIEANRLGYVPRDLTVRLSPAEQVELGEMTLIHERESERAVGVAGWVRLSDQTMHAGTLVTLRTQPDNVFIASTLTLPDGAFHLRASPNERYSIGLTREGYQASVGWDSVQFDAGDERFEDEASQPLEITLQPSLPPVRGRISVQTNIGPAWLPDADKTVSVRVEALDETGPPTVIAGVSNETAAEFSDLALGRYRVEVFRVGFEGTSIETELTRDTPVVELGPMAIQLRDLAVSGIALGGRVVDGCELRTLANVNGANLANVTLAGRFSAIEPGVCPQCVQAGDPSCAPIDLRQVRLSNADLTRVTDMQSVDLTEASLFGANLQGVNLANAILTRADLSAANLSLANLIGADLSQALMSNANLSDARLSSEQWRNTPRLNPCLDDGEGPAIQLAGADLSGVNFNDAHLDGVHLMGADLSGVRMRRASLVGACLKDAILSLADGADADFKDADLRSARAVNAVFSRADLRGADLRHSFLASSILDSTELGCKERTPDGRCDCDLKPNDDDAERFTSLCLGDALLDAQCRCRTLLGQANLAGVSLLGTDLTGADLRQSVLTGSILGTADTRPQYQPVNCQLPEGCLWAQIDQCVTLPAACTRRGVSFVDSNLSAASLEEISSTGLDLTGADVRYAQLAGISLRESRFLETDFRYATMTDANLSGNRFEATRFEYADLRRATLADVVFDTETWMTGAELTAVNMANSNLRQVRFHTAHTSGLTVTASELCEYRSTFVGEPQVFEATCGPMYQEVTGGSLEWTRVWDQSPVPISGVQTYLKVDLDYSFQVKTYPLTHSELVVLSDADPRFFDGLLDFLEGVTDEVSFDNGERGCDVFYLLNQNILTVYEDAPCFEVRSPVGLRADDTSVQRLSESVMIRRAAAIFNQMSVKAGLEPCFYEEGSEEVYTLDDVDDGATPSWPKGINCPGYRWLTRDEYIWTVTSGGDAELFGRYAVERDNFHGDSALAAPGCAYSGDTNRFGICDLVGNWPELVSPRSHDGCDGISNRPAIVRAGFGLINRQNRGWGDVEFEHTFFGINSGDSNASRGALSGPDGRTPLNLYQLRPTRTVFEPCAELGAMETRACGHGEMVQQERRCENQGWSVWSPCVTSSTMCPSRDIHGDYVAFTSPADGEQYGWRQNGTRLGVVEELVDEACLEPPNVPFIGAAQYWDADARHVACNPETVGSELLVSYGDLSGQTDGTILLNRTLGDGLEQAAFASDGQLGLNRVYSLNTSRKYDYEHYRPNIGETLILHGPAPNPACTTRMVEREVNVIECARLD